MRSKTNKYYFILVVALSVCLSPVFVFAVGSDAFTVTQTINTFDPTPPTIPDNFSVTPVTSSQIDLDWDASSDNIGVAGYQVFRDAVQIATTTLTAFSDTGLTASTAYAYNLIAFDVALNFSTSTAVLSTTTLPVVIPPAPTATSTGSAGYYVTAMKIENLLVDSGEDYIALQFATNQFARSSIRWGQTESYELGFTGTDTFQKYHQTVIDGLSPNTTYQIEIVLYDKYGLESIRFATEVRTDSRPDDQPPTNVTGLQAVTQNGVVILSWQNPTISDFSKVRVLSSDRVYPVHIADGWLVYEGDSTSARDTRPVEVGMTRYYTVFVYDKAGNISSGSVAAVRLRADGADTMRVQMGEPVASSTIQDPQLAALVFEDIQFVQDDEDVSLVDAQVVLAGNKETYISIPYTKLPEHLKTIVVTFASLDDPELVFSFLLRVNQDKTEYAALVGPLVKAGLYPVSVSIFDLKTEQLVQIDGSVVVTSDAAGDEDIFRETVSGVSNALRLTTMCLLMLLFVLLVWRRRGS